MAVVSAPERPVNALVWSVERHPWYLDKLDVAEFRKLAEHADAVGEIGLDRLRGADFNIQMENLRLMLKVAAELDKTVIFHCVRAVPELIGEVKKYPKMRKLFHGFNGKTESLNNLLRHGFAVSLGERALRNGKLILPECGRIGIESDDSPVSLAELYGLRDIKNIKETFEELFGIYE